jgi:GNAT superfamily N-acetyltransferase
LGCDDATMAAPVDLRERTRIAIADAWQAEGVLREARGGAARGLRDVRLMASGLPYAQWNTADVTGRDPDIEGARAFYADRGLPWGLRLEAGRPCDHGRHVARQRLMALSARGSRRGRPVPGLHAALAAPVDLDSVVAIDAAAFGEDPETNRPWIEPHLGASGVETAIAALRGRPVATAYTLLTEERAGPSLYVGGVAVLAEARGQGVAAAVTSWLLQRGFAAGADFAHLHADTDESARVFARLGFVEAGGLDVYAEP